MRALGLALALLIAVPAVAAAKPDLPPQWPDPGTAGAIAGERVTFPSFSPFSIADAGGDAEDNPPTDAVATLFLPPDASAAAPVPAVVMLHGASGVQDARGLTYGRQFAAMGVAALVVDTFAARRHLARTFVERVLNITEAMFLADAYGALAYLDARPDVDAGRVALIGFSYGGMVTTYAAYAQVAERFSPEGRRFIAHVAYYAPCIAEFQDSRATGAPVLMIYGARDAIVDPARCQAVADALQRGGARVETVVYPDAVHQWDGRMDGPRPIGRNLAPCHFLVERDGTIRDRYLPVVMSGPFTRKILLMMCIDDEGYLIGRDDSVRARSNRDVGAFLERAFSARAEARAPLAGGR